MLTIKLHTALRRFANDQATLKIKADNASLLLKALCDTHPDLGQCLMEPSSDSKLSQYINIYINGENWRSLDPQQPLTEQDEIEIITALVGG